MRCVAEIYSVSNTYQTDKFQLVIYKRRFNSLRFSFMMKEVGLTEFPIGTPSPQTNVSAIGFNSIRNHFVREREVHHTLGIEINNAVNVNEKVSQALVNF